MSTYLKNNTTGSADSAINVVDDEWDLDRQLEGLLAWLQAHPDFDFSSGAWVADVGFSSRPNVTVAGYTVSVELMAALSRNRVTLWLSDYGHDGQEACRIKRP